MFWPCVMLLLLLRSGRTFVCRRFHDVTLSIHQPDNFFVFFLNGLDREKKEVHVCVHQQLAQQRMIIFSHIFTFYILFFFLLEELIHFFVRNCVTCLSPIYFSDHYIWWSALFPSHFQSSYFVLVFIFLFFLIIECFFCFCFLNLVCLGDFPTGVVKQN